MKKFFSFLMFFLCLLILGALVLNLMQGGIWIKGLDGKDGQDGVDGANGQNGLNGQDGQNGKDGKSAYELALEDGFEGSLHEWLLSLAVKGSDGQNGLPGAAGVGIRNVAINAQGHLIVTLTDGTALDAGAVEGGEPVFSDEPDEMGFYPVWEMVVLENVEQSLNLRLTPDTVNGEILTAVNKGTELLRVGDQKTENGFSRFLYNGQYCYARSRFFELKYTYDGEIPEINLPDSIALTLGVPTWFYTDQICASLPEDMTVVYSYSGSGERIFEGDEGFCINPAKVGNATLSVKIQTYADDDLRTIYEKSIAVTVSAPNSELKLTGIVIGDSRISDGTLVNTLHEKLPNLTLLGTRKTSDGVLHEGRGAWSTAHYLHNASLNVGGSTDVVNAFYNPAEAVKGFDFSYYMAQNYPDTKVDFVVINLGANDSFSKESAENINTMIASIHAYSADIKVLVLTEYRSPAKGYSLIQTTNLNVGAMRIRQFRYFTYLSEILGGRTEEGIYLLPSYLSINAWSDWKRAETQTQNGVEERITDVIHLGSAGYKKEAAAVISYLQMLFQ